MLSIFKISEMTALESPSPDMVKAPNSHSNIERNAVTLAC